MQGSIHVHRKVEGVRMTEAISQTTYALTLFTDQEDLPVFRGESFEDHVDAWQALDLLSTRHQWAQAAIASSLERKSGTRTDVTGGKTDIQRFCREVKISTGYFSRLVKTYRTFAEPLDPSVKQLISESPLHFKHFVVAANGADDPVAAVVQAHDQNWSANELVVQLRAFRRSKKTQEANPLGQEAADLGTQRTVRIILPANEHREFVRQARALGRILCVNSGTSLAQTIQKVVERIYNERTAGAMISTTADNEVLA
jgi:hypothetical protein